jgi:hypothetical protein
MAKGKEKPQGQGLEPCGTCAGVECGTARIPVCCADCTH